MKKPIDLLIYDLDGTLVDSLRDIVDAVNHMLAELGLPLRSLEEVRGFVGEGVWMLVERALGEESSPLAKCGIKLLREHYARHLLDHSRLYPGVLEMLQHFESKKQAVVTNKPEKLTHDILKGLGVDHFFALVMGGDSPLAKKKPSPEPVLYALKTLHIQPERAVMIGDSWVDVETGRKAGVNTCAVTYGFGDLQRLHGSHADFLIGHFADLLTLFD